MVNLGVCTGQSKAMKHGKIFDRPQHQTERPVASKFGVSAPLDLGLAVLLVLGLDVNTWESRRKLLSTILSLARFA